MLSQGAPPFTLLANCSLAAPWPISWLTVRLVAASTECRVCVPARGQCDREQIGCNENRYVVEMACAVMYHSLTGRHRGGATPDASDAIRAPTGSKMRHIHDGARPTRERGPTRLCRVVPVRSCPQRRLGRCGTCAQAHHQARRTAKVAGPALLSTLALRIDGVRGHTGPRKCVQNRVYESAEFARSSPAALSGRVPGNKRARRA
jgi:hypothetical protein